MTQFYGFNWQQAPAYSRLFSPNVMQQAQGAYGHGMGQFTPYDPAQLEKLRAAQQAKLAAAQVKPQAQTISSKFMVGPDGRVFDVSDQKSFLQQYEAYAPRDGQQSYAATLYALKKGRDLSTIGFKPLGSK